ncbi:MAG: hypothetical protein WA021_03425 [Minisyncoccia bacterium]
MNVREFIDSLPQQYPSDSLIRCMPSSFDPNDPTLRAIPRPRSWRWESCALFLQTFAAETVILQTPLFWQLYSPLHTMCREIGCSIYPNEPDNFPVGGAALTSARANVVIIEAIDAAPFATYLHSKNISLPQWIIIHRPESEWTIPDALANVRVAQEVHLFPGIPILHQCHAGIGTNIFHPSHEFTWNFESPTTLSGDVFNNLELPFNLQSTSCTCGSAAYIQKA